MAKKKTTSTSYSFTAEDIVRERDTQKQSWAIVATQLGLKSPSAARTAYADLTGRPHTDSQIKVNRAPSGQGPRAQKAQAATPKKDNCPHWNVDSDQDEIINRLTPQFDTTPKGERVFTYKPRIVVERERYHQPWQEEIVVTELRGFSYNKNESRLWVELYQENGAFRCVYVDDIVEVY